MSVSTPEGIFTQILSELCTEISFRSFQKQMTINSVCPHCNQQCELISKKERVRGREKCRFNFVDEKAGLDIYGNRIDSNGSVSHYQSLTTESTSTTTATTTTATIPSTSTASNSSMITVECPCCKKVLAATRFAPHLEKCMGMGRQSARKR